MPGSLPSAVSLWSQFIPWGVSPLHFHDASSGLHLRQLLTTPAPYPEVRCFLQVCKWPEMPETRGMWLGGWLHGGDQGGGQGLGSGTGGSHHRSKI